VDTGRFNSLLAPPRPADPGAGRKALFQARAAGAPLFAQRNSLAILEPSGYDRWLGPEPDPHDLLITYRSEPMTMWPISTRVNKPENDDPSLLDRTADPFDVWAPLRAEGRA
jgi:putative SOS response-associated peptidase YedK